MISPGTATRMSTWSAPKALFGEVEAAVNYALESTATVRKIASISPPAMRVPSTRQLLRTPSRSLTD
jgi:hypothetical protein